MIQFRPVLRVLGILLLLVGGMMWTGLPFSWYFGSGDGLSLFFSGLICMAFGLPLFWFVRPGPKEQIRKREGYLVVASGWIGMVLFGSLPYILSGVMTTIPDALFETASGMTTTGASVLVDIEGVPQGILYWRSLTQWIGGMGIIVLTVAIFPLLGIGGIELFVAEAPGPISDKLTPRISDTAKRLWYIYVGLTFLLMLVLRFLGMTSYDAVNHALTTMATGGFSTKNDSMAFYQNIPAIQYVIVLFMFLAGTNYTMLYLGLNRQFRRVWKSDEFRAYVFLVLLLTVFVTIKVKFDTGLDWEQAFRDSIFQIVSVITTTGYISADYTSWSGSLTMLFFILLFLGASAGSTSGGIKIVRHLVFFKNSMLEFKRLLHPRAVVPLKLNDSIVPGRILIHIIIFLLIYLAIFVIGSIIVAAMGVDFLTAIGAVATSLGNVGPGIGNVGPVNNFAGLTDGVKLFLAFLMLLGRLELFTILVLFTPYYWRSA